MKTDPEHVAWTCSHCGELAFTAVGERPAAPPPVPGLALLDGVR